MLGISALRAPTVGPLCCSHGVPTMTMFGQARPAKGEVRCCGGGAKKCETECIKKGRSADPAECNPPGSDEMPMLLATMITEELATTAKNDCVTGNMQGTPYGLCYGPTVAPWNHSPKCSQKE